MTRGTFGSSMRLRSCAAALLALLLSVRDAPATEAAVAARTSPDWLRDAVIYEVFPRAFSHDGGFQGIVPQLDRLKALGVSVIWLMPIHPVGRLRAKGTLGSPYAVRDYEAVNPEFGSAADLKKLIAAAHQRGLRVFIDVVANHTSWDSVLIRRHPQWFTHDAGGHIIAPNPDWVDVADLDWSQPDLRRYMTGMLAGWLRDYGLDGFRCDYASGVPMDFWEELRPELDKVRPDLALLAEADDPELLRQAFDVDYAWDFYHVMSDALVGRKPAAEVRAVWERAAARYPRGALRLRFSDNHDQLRATGQAGLPAAMAASAVMFTLDGVPLLYNGMEIGDTVESLAPALFERAPIQWQVAERRPHVAEFYRQLAALRRAHAAFTRGEVRWLDNSDPARLLSYQRISTGPDAETLTVVVNLSSQPFTGTVATGAGAWQDITPASTTDAGAPPEISLGAWEFRVFRRQGTAMDTH